ncbi:alpha/beta hydrolase fold domain-containing protein [Microbacterium sp. NPDC055357]
MPPREQGASRPIALIVTGADPKPSSEFATELASVANAVVVVADIRWERTGQTPIDDADRILQWVRSNHERLGTDPARVAIVGEGAGAQITTALVERVRARGTREFTLHVTAGSESAGHALVVADDATGALAVSGDQESKALARQIRSSLDALDHERIASGAAAPPPPALDIDCRVEPATRKFLDHLARWDATSIATIRRAYGALPRPTVPPADQITRVDITITSADASWEIPLRIHRPTQAAGPLPAVVYLHGGGYIMGTINENDDRLDQLALELDCVVVSVDYRLAPEHPYPAALDDAAAAWRAIRARAADFGIDARRIALAGSSAGAGLAAALCIRLRERGERQPCLQVLVYPMLDDHEHASVRALEGGAGHWGLWPLRAERLAWAAYLGDLASADTPPATAVPGRATRAQLVGLAPAFIGVGDVDALVDSNLLYAKKLIAAGVTTEVHVYPGVIHGGFVPRPVTEGTRRFLRDVYGALRRALHDRSAEC